MTDDFVTRLRLQLREAALREEGRGAAARGAASARSLVRSAALRPAVAILVTVLAVIVAIAAVLRARPEPPGPPAAPRVVARFTVAGQLGVSAAHGFGAMWLSDRNEGRVVRVDARSRRVTARLRVGGEASIAAGAGAVWALPLGDAGGGTAVLRIDPRTGRGAARIPLRTPSGAPFVAGHLVAGRAVWAAGFGRALRIDPRRNRVAGQIALPGAPQGYELALRGRDLWVAMADGAILRFDARTGARRSRAQMDLQRPGRL